MKSAQYSVYDIDGASDIIRSELAQMEGVKQLNTGYTDDALSSSSLEYINSLDRGKYDECAVFEAVHGSAPTHAGKGDANPTALILSAVLMLRHLGEREAADRIFNAVRAVLAEGKDVTYDIKRAAYGSTEGAVGTDAYADAVIARL